MNPAPTPPPLHSRVLNAIAGRGRDFDLAQNHGGGDIKRLRRLSEWVALINANFGLPADIYHLYLIARQIDAPLKSITLNLGNVHIYANNEAKARELLAGNETLRFDLNV